jgi:hypothetical protein
MATLELRSNEAGPPDGLYETVTSMTHFGNPPPGCPDGMCCGRRAWRSRCRSSRRCCPGPGGHRRPSNPGKKTDAVQPRLLCCYIPNGVNIKQWVPTDSGANYTLSPTLEALKDHRNDFTVLSGLGHPCLQGGAQWSRYLADRGQSRKPTRCRLHQHVVDRSTRRRGPRTPHAVLVTATQRSVGDR